MQRLLAPALFLLLLAPQSASATLSDGDMRAMLQALDDRQKNSGDYKALIYMEQSGRFFSRPINCISTNISGKRSKKAGKRVPHVQ